MKLFPSLTNNLVDKGLRDVNGCAILNFSSLRINLRRNGISNLFFEPHTLDWFTVPKIKVILVCIEMEVVVLLFDDKP